VNDLNEYQKAILSIGEILQDYDDDNRFPVYGFGGSINGQVSHCFPINFCRDQPELAGLGEVLGAYKNSFQYVSLSGPTLFAPIISLACDAAERNQRDTSSQKYTVLLILTDGVINDLDQTKEQIIRGSELPLSIVIVGVGNADFTTMEILDADDNPLEYRGKRMKRDIVQFVPFRQFKQAHYSLLAQETLREIPGQVTGYYKSRGILPNAPIPASHRHLAIEQSQRALLGHQSSSTAPIAIPVSTPPVPPTGILPSAPAYF